MFITTRIQASRAMAAVAVSAVREIEVWQYMQQGASHEIQRREPAAGSHNYIQEAEDGDEEVVYAKKLQKTRAALQPRELHSAIRAAVKAVHSETGARERDEVVRNTDSRIQALCKAKELALVDAGTKISEAQFALREADERFLITEDIAEKAAELGIESSVANEDLQNAHLGLDFAKRALVQAEAHKKQCAKVIPHFVKQAEDSTSAAQQSATTLQSCSDGIVRAREAAGLTEEEMNQFLNPELDAQEQAPTLRALTLTPTDW